MISSTHIFSLSLKLGWQVRRTILTALVGVWLITPAFLTAPAFAEPVDVAGSSAETYDRLTFDWPRSVEYSAERFGDTLVIRFSRPIEADFDAALSQLGSYVSGGRIGSDGRSVVVELTGNHRLRSDRNGNRIVIDLVSRDAPATPAPVAASSGTPTLGVRVGRHPDYDRIVFDWPRSVRYATEKKAGSAVLTFERAAEIDAAAVRRRLPADLRGFAAETAGGKTIVTIPLPPGSDLRTLASGPKVVADVRRGVATASPTQDPTPSPTPSPAAGSATKPAEEPTPAPAPVAKVETEGSTPPPSTSAPQSAAQASIPPATTEGGASAPAAQPATLPETKTAIPGQEEVKEKQEAARPIQATQLPQGGPTEDLDPNAPDVQSFIDIGEAKIQGPPLLVTTTPTELGLSLRFNFEEPVAAAAFKRAGYFWMAFEAPVTFDTSRVGASQILGTPEQIPSTSGSILRIPTVEGVNARAWRDGDAWMFDMQPQASRPDVSLRVDSQLISPQGPRLFIPVEGVGQPMVVQDPEVGDGIFVVPVVPLSRGIDGDRTFPELTILSSIQGIAMRPELDGIEVRVLPDGVAFTLENGLFISGESEAQEEDILNARRFDGLPLGLPPGRVYDMSNWRRGDTQDFLEARQALQLQISKATSISRSGPRLQLAQFYFARGLAAETIGLLRTIAQTDEDLANRPDVKSLWGASNFMLGRYAEAEEMLDDVALNGFSEIELWRGASAAGQAKWDKAFEHFARAGEIPGGYPKNYSTELALLAAEAAIRTGDPRAAGAFLDVISEGQPTPGELARLEYLRGRVLYSFGDVDAGIEIWQNLTEGADRWARVRAESALINHDLESGRISPREATQRLASLVFAWRGDRLELMLLKQLGDLYLAEHLYEEGLDALRLAVTFFPREPEAREIAGTLTDTFTDIFIGGAAEELTPIEALSLYDKFRELTPVGKTGDRIIEGLADRLVQVDLLERAARLLDRQVKFRLEGTDKARIGARLALIHLFDVQPESAIRALDESVAPGLSPKIARERRRLRARAVFELGDAAGALKLLEKDDAREADLLRADIHWRTQNWIESAKTFRRLVGNAGRDGKRLSPEAATYIVNWAVALALSDNVRGLNQLRQVYSSQMDRTAFRESFRLITSNTDAEIDDFMRLSERFEEIGRFQAFLSSYRDRLKTEPLSATN